MGVYTTNWYLYKTQFHAISTKSQTQKPRTETEVYLKKEKMTPIRKWRLTEQ